MAGLVSRVSTAGLVESFFYIVKNWSSLEHKTLGVLHGIQQHRTAMTIQCYRMAHTDSNNNRGTVILNSALQC